MKGYVLTCVYQAYSSLENCVHPWQNMMRRLIRNKVAEKEHSLLHSAMLQFLFSVVIHSVLWLFLPSSLSSSSLSISLLNVPPFFSISAALFNHRCESMNHGWHGLNLHPFFTLKVCLPQNEGISAIICLLSCQGWEIICPLVKYIWSILICQWT